MNSISLPKEDRSTKHVTDKMLGEIANRLVALENGTVEIFVKNGYVLGIERKERIHFTAPLDR